jgi:hypothetical protein
VAILACVLVSGAAAIYALASSPPLTMHITGIRTTGYLAGIRQLNVSVHNNTDKPLRPRYTVQNKNGDTTFWRVWQSVETIPAGKTEHIQLLAPNYEAEPGLGDGFSVTAFTHSPSAVSVSHRFLLNLPRTALYPAAFNNAQLVGKRIELQVQLLDNLDNPLRRRGVVVYMTQLLYIGPGVHGASARINGHRPGKGKVPSKTNADGVATFYVVGTRSSRTPITFSAHLYDKGANYVYGSTGYLNIRFAKPGDQAVPSKKR